MKQNIVLKNVLVELLYQALETEKGGVQIYVTALRCAVDTELKEEWNKYLEQTKNQRVAGYRRTLHEIGNHADNRRI